MITCGIDIGKGRHAAALLDESGREIGLAKFYDNTRQGAEKLLERLRAHSDLASVRVGMESTGNYWRAFYDHLANAGCRVDVINPIVTKASSASDIRGLKTDKRDALVIADVVFRGNYVAKPAENGPERGLKVLMCQRGFLVGECTAAKLHMLDSLSETFPEFESLFEDKFGNYALAVLEKYPGAHALARAHLPSVMKIVKERTRGKDVEADAKKLIAAAKDSICVDCAIHEEIGECIRSSVKTIRGLRKRIAEIEKLIEACDPPKAVICVFAKLLEIVCSLYKTGRTYTVEKPSTEVVNNRKVVNNEVSRK